MNIYALTDSHQESRNLSILLSGICEFEMNSESDFLVLDGGDLFKGIYDKELSVNAYIEFKRLCPRANVFIGLGNNDFGFKHSDFEYLKSTTKRFSDSGISVLCANLVDSNGIYPEWVERYKILTVGNCRVLLTSFCLNNSCVKRFGYNLLPIEDEFLNLLSSIEEPYDKIFVINHHWYLDSKNLFDFCKSKRINIDLIIGGHEHSPIAPDFDRNIYYPLSFARGLYKILFEGKVISASQINLDNFNIMEHFEIPINNYEVETGLKEVLANRLLNLPKSYSEPCALGTFISDKMRSIGNTDIAFHSTGFTMYPLRVSDSKFITRYDLLKVMCANSKLVKVDLSIADLVNVFQNALINRMHKDRGNARFLQCSQNVKIVGKGNSLDKTYKLVQLYIDDVPLLDKNLKPIDNTKKYSCTIDSYIADGEQGFSILKNMSKEDVLKNGNPVRINEVFFDSVIEENNKLKTESLVEYPSFQLIDL